jgi:hypothetical protein
MLLVVEVAAAASGFLTWLSSLLQAPGCGRQSGAQEHQPNKQRCFVPHVAKFWLSESKPGR